MLGELEGQAVDEVADEGIGREAIEIRRRIAYLRFAGQETALEVAVEDDAQDLASALAAAFEERYEALYGYRPAARPIEVESLRVVASSRPPEPRPDPGRRTPERRPAATRYRPAVSAPSSPAPGGRWRSTPAPTSSPATRSIGPALVLDDYATLVVEVGWRAEVAANGTIVVRR